MFTFLDSTGAGMGATGTWGTIIMIVIMFAVFYFFAIRPQKKQEKESQQMRNRLRPVRAFLEVGRRIIPPLESKIGLAFSKKYATIHTDK